MLQTQTNLLGVSAMAANSGAGAIDHITLNVVNALPVTCGVFIGQNLGAQKQDRVKKVLWYCLGLEVILGILVTACSYLIRRPILSIVLSDDPVAFELAMVKLDRMLPWIMFNGIGSLCEQFLRNLGYTKSSSSVTIITKMILRLIFAWFIYPLFGTFSVLMLHYGIGYFVNFLGQAAISVVAYYRYGKGKYKRL